MSTHAGVSGSGARRAGWRTGWRSGAASSADAVEAAGGTGSLALFPGVKPWKPAREIIDWSIKGRSIFGRAKDLAPKTMARIYAGALKHRWPEPYLVILRNHMAARGLDLPLPVIAAGGGHIGLAEPVLINGRRNNQARAVSAVPVPTLDTKGGVWLAEPIVLGTGQGASRPASEPLPTITTGGAGNDDHQGCARPMLVEPFVVSPRHARDGAGPRPRSVDEPLPTLTSSGSQVAVVEPFVLSQGAGGVPRAVAEPLPTTPTHGAHALIAPYYGSGSGETCVSDADPLPTVTSVARFGMVVPVTNGSGGPAARDVDGPLATMTTAKGGEFALVVPLTHAGGLDRVQDDGVPLPTVTGANRGELAFITAQHGEREGQAPRTHDIAEPAPTIAASGHVDLVVAEAVRDGERYDILFRMLEPHELAAAIGFSDEEAAYEFAGTKTEQIKQIGNAVSVAKMRACVGALMADAAPKRVPAADDESEALRVAAE